MTETAQTTVLVATGPNEVELTPVGDAKQPQGFSGSGTYTVSNKGANRLTVLMSGKLVAAPAGATDGAPAAAPPNATVNVTPPRVVLDPGANAQARADISIPPGTAQTKAMLELFFRDEQKPNEIYARYTSGVGVPSSSKPTNWKLILLIVAIILVILIGAAVAFFLFRGGGDAKTFAIPAVRGMTEADATKALQEDIMGCDKPCFKVEPKQVVDADPEVQIGQVIKTDPAVDEKAERGSTVQLLLLKGVEVPDVNNRTEQEARDLLAAACEPSPCLNASSIRVPSFETNAGNAMATIPAAQKEAKKGSTVTLYVSDGSHHLVMPSEPPDSADVDVGEASKTPDLFTSKFFSLPVVATGTAAEFMGDSNAPIGARGCKGPPRNGYAFSALSAGMHICLRTSAGRTAELIVAGVSSTLVLDYVVWPRSILDDLKNIPNKEIFEKVKAINP
jgi:hypothetical protein